MSCPNATPDIRRTSLQTSLLLMNPLSSDQSIDQPRRQPEKRLKLFDTVSVSPTLCPTFSNFSNFVSPGSFSILPHLIKPQTSLINSKFKKGWTVFPPFNPVKSVQKSDYRTTGAKTNQTVILQIRIFDRPKIKWPETWQQT